MIKDQLERVNFDFMAQDQMHEYLFEGNDGSIASFSSFSSSDNNSTSNYNSKFLNNNNNTISFNNNNEKEFHV